jgi:hypothetical protein
MGYPNLKMELLTISIAGVQLRENMWVAGMATVLLVVFMVVSKQFIEHLTCIKNYTVWPAATSN